MSLEGLRYYACFLLSSFYLITQMRFAVSHVTGLEDDVNLVLRGEVTDVA